MDPTVPPQPAETAVCVYCQRGGFLVADMEYTERGMACSACALKRQGGAVDTHAQKIDARGLRPSWIVFALGVVAALVALRACV
jgi:hypothetical protein